MLLAILIVACALRLPLLGHEPWYDELYHLLAAEGWQETSTFRIGHGEYTRAALWTLVVAGAKSLFGSTLAAARLPSLLASLGLVALVFVWLRGAAGRWPATVTSVLVALWPEGIELAQWARFYALQNLTFVGSVVVFFSLVHGKTSSNFAARVVGFLLLASISVHLTPLSLIGYVGLGAWAAPTIASRLEWRDRRVAIGAALCAAACLAAIPIAFATGLAQDLVVAYRNAGIWSAAQRDSERFYLIHLVTDYPLLWSALPVACAVAWTRDRRLTGLSACIFATCFVVLSFGGMKSVRYLSFAMPFFFVIWGLALARLIDPARRLLDSVSASVDLPTRVRHAATWSIAAGVLLFVVASNNAFLRASAFGMGSTWGVSVKPAAWTEAVRVLGELPPFDVVVTTGDLEALYHLGGYDFWLVNGGEDFVVDPRTGLPAVSSAAALDAVVQCSASGVLLGPRARWTKPGRIDPEVVAYASSRLDPLRLPERPGADAIVAFTWHHERAAGDPRCAAFDPTTWTDKAYAASRAVATP